MKKLVFFLAFIALARVEAQNSIRLSADSGEEEVVVPRVVKKPLVVKKKKAVQYDEAANEVQEVEVVEEAPRAFRNQRVQEQPLTVVEASPLRESRADVMRKQRQDIEAKTEQKIVEKLEESRIEDEKVRSERLFGDAFSGGSKKNSTNEAVVAAPAPVAAPVYVAPQPVVVAPPAPIAPPVAPIDEKLVEKDIKEVSVREEVREALKDFQPQKEEELTSYYIGGQVGLSEYPDVKNLKGYVASGFTLGVITPERIVVEGSFLYSTYRLEIADSYYYYPTLMFKDLAQYASSVGVKYQLLPGKIKPTLGAFLGYTYRKYSDPSKSLVKGPDVSSNAFDAGLSAGLDLQITKTLAIGAEFRYTTNISNKRDNDYGYSLINPQSSTPVEELDYYSMAISGKLTF